MLRRQLLHDRHQPRRRRRPLLPLNPLDALRLRFSVCHPRRGSAVAFASGSGLSGCHSRREPAFAFAFKAAEVHPTDVPRVPQPQEPFLPQAQITRLQRIVNLFPPGQFLRYIAVGGFNTFFGYGTAAGILYLLNHHAPARYLYLTVPAASILSTPLNITVAYFGYKFFVFKTKGNYLKEWLRTFAVYGTGMIPGLLALSAVTRFFQTTLHLGHASGYLALALIQGLTTIYSFIGHKTFSFKR